MHHAPPLLLLSILLVALALALVLILAPALARPFGQALPRDVYLCLRSTIAARLFPGGSKTLHLDPVELSVTLVVRLPAPPREQPSLATYLSIPSPINNTYIFTCKCIHIPPSCILHPIQYT